MIWFRRGLAAVTDSTDNDLTSQLIEFLNIPSFTFPFLRQPLFKLVNFRHAGLYSVGFSENPEIRGPFSSQLRAASVFQRLNTKSHVTDFELRFNQYDISVDSNLMFTSVEHTVYLLLQTSR
jgi:hypothetical protein